MPLHGFRVPAARPAPSAAGSALERSARSRPVGRPAPGSASVAGPAPTGRGPPASVPWPAPTSGSASVPRLAGAPGTAAAARRAAGRVGPAPAGALRRRLASPARRPAAPHPAAPGPAAAGRRSPQPGPATLQPPAAPAAPPLRRRPPAARRLAAGRAARRTRLSRPRRQPPRRLAGTGRLRPRRAARRCRRCPGVSARPARRPARRASTRGPPPGRTTTPCASTAWRAHRGAGEAGRRRFNPEAVASAVLPSVFRVRAGEFTGTAFAVGKARSGGGTNLFTNYPRGRGGLERRRPRRSSWSAPTSDTPRRSSRSTRPTTWPSCSTDAASSPGWRPRPSRSKSGQQIVVVGAPLGLEDTRDHRRGQRVPGRAGRPGRRSSSTPRSTPATPAAR